VGEAAEHAAAPQGAKAARRVRGLFYSVILRREPTTSASLEGCCSKIAAGTLRGPRCARASQGDDLIVIAASVSDEAI